jgi:DnaJ-class molecular chaperone
MSTLLLDPPSLVREACNPVRPQSKEDGWEARETAQHGRLTLDELITGVWEGLAIREAVDCPACGGTMASRAAVRAGACRDCGSTLS